MSNENQYIEKYSTAEHRGKKAWIALTGIVLLGCLVYGFAIFYKGPVVDDSLYRVQLRFGRFWDLDSVVRQDTGLMAHATLDDDASVDLLVEPLQEDTLLFANASDEEIQAYAAVLEEQYRSPTTASQAALPYGSIETSIVVVNGKRLVRLRYPGPNEITQMIWEGNYNDNRYRILASCPAKNSKLRTRIEQTVQTLTIGD